MEGQLENFLPVHARLMLRTQAGEVLVRVHAAGVNPDDWQIRSGLAHRYQRFGCTR